MKNLHAVLATLAILFVPVGMSAQDSVGAFAQHTRAGGGTAIPRVARPAKPAPNTNAMIWRFIGPIAGTRGSAVLGHPTERTVFYHGASAGPWMSTPMKDAFDRITAERDTANQRYQSQISGALNEFEAIAGK